MALAAPLDKLKPLEREVSDVQSTEGGMWQIYRDKDGRVNSIVRLDAGESGKLETRLSVVNRQIWGIARTRFDYIRHAFLEGPFAIIRTETNYYFFCAGKPYVPPPESSTLDNAQYENDAKAAWAVFLGAKEIADFTKELK